MPEANYSVRRNIHRFCNGFSPSKHLQLDADKHLTQRRERIFLDDLVLLHFASLCTIAAPTSKLNSELDEGQHILNDSIVSTAAGWKLDESGASGPIFRTAATRNRVYSTRHDGQVRFLMINWLPMKSDDMLLFRGCCGVAVERTGVV